MAGRRAGRCGILAGIRAGSQATCAARRGSCRRGASWRFHPTEDDVTGLVDPGSTRSGVNPRLKPADGSLPPAGRLAKVLALEVLLPAIVWFLFLCGVGYLLGHQ